MSINFLVAVSIWLFLPGIIYYVSQQVSLIGVYHKLKDQHVGGETFLEKFCKISKCNILLSIPIIITLYIIIGYSPADFQPKDAFFLSLPIAIILLSATRLLSNPSKITKPSLCKFCPVYGNVDEVIKLQKERIISFFFSLICTTMVLMLTLLSYSILFNRPLQITGISSLAAAETVLIYFFVLEVMTAVVELLLAKLLPPLKPIDP